MSDHRPGEWKLTPQREGTSRESEDSYETGNPLHAHRHPEEVPMHQEWLNSSKRTFLSSAPPLHEMNGSSITDEANGLPPPHPSLQGDLIYQNRLDGSTQSAFYVPSGSPRAYQRNSPPGADHHQSSRDSTSSHQKPGAKPPPTARIHYLESDTLSRSNIQAPTRDASSFPGLLSAELDSLFGRKFVWDEYADEACLYSMVRAWVRDGEIHVAPEKRKYRKRPAVALNATITEERSVATQTNTNEPILRNAQRLVSVSMATGVASRPGKDVLGMEGIPDMNGSPPVGIDEAITTSSVSGIANDDEGNLKPAAKPPPSNNSTDEPVDMLGVVRAQKRQRIPTSQLKHVVKSWARGVRNRHREDFKKLEAEAKASLEEMGIKL